jgi:hypothetical protein
LDSDGRGRTDLSFGGISLVYPDEADGGTPINPLLKDNGALDCTEQEARQSANIAWLEDTYSRAEDNGARAIVISFHANLLLNPNGVTVSGQQRKFFQPYVGALREEALSFPIPTLHIYGDSHTFTVDKPYKVTRHGDTIENIMRLQVLGPSISEARVPQDQWVQVHVNATREAVKQGVDKVFTFSVCSVTTGECTLQP